MNHQSLGKLYPLFACILLLMSAILVPSSLRAANPPKCKISTSLNLRSSPGVANNNRLGALDSTSQIEPTAQAKDASNQVWFQVRVVTTKSKDVTVGTVGWVLASPTWLTCTPSLTNLKTTLPAANAPSAPAPNKQVAYTELPGGRAGGGFDGLLRTEQGMATTREDDTYGTVSVFQNNFYVRMEVYQTPDNRKVDRVEFSIEDEFNNIVHTQTERTAGYCLFGGGEPNCTALTLRRGAKWPSTNLPILNGYYTVYAKVYVQGQNSPGSYNTQIQIDIPGNASNNDDLVVDVVQTGPGGADYAVYDQLAFQVQAYAPESGDYDGAGIQGVDLWVEDLYYDTIFASHENNAAYCMFGGGDPDCNIWSFSENGYQWPNGKAFEPGQYYLVAHVVAKDGRQKTIDTMVEFE